MDSATSLFTSFTSIILSVVDFVLDNWLLAILVVVPVGCGLIAAVINLVRH